MSEPNTQALWRQQGVQAPAYYLAAAALTSWIDQRDFPQVYDRANPHAAIGRSDATVNRNYLIHHADERWPWRGSFLALHVTRFFSILLGAVTLWATYRTLALLVGSDLALLGTALFGFIPQFIFISAAASNDNAINALAALVLWRLVKLVVGPPSLEARHPAITADPVRSDPERAGEAVRSNDFSRSPAMGRRLKSSLRTFSSDVAPHPAWPSTLELVGLGCLLGLASLTKLSALGLIALTGLALMIVAWRLPERRGLKPLDDSRTQHADHVAWRAAGAPGVETP